MSEDGRFAASEIDPVSTMFNFPVGVKLFLTTWRDVSKSKAGANAGGLDLGEMLEADSVFGEESVDAADAASLMSYSEGDSDGIRSDTEANGETESGPGGTIRDGEEVAASAFQLDGVSAMQHVTRPPSRFTEASFIKELETIGVGRPSTYSKIFQILKEREYLHVDKQVTPLRLFIHMYPLLQHMYPLLRTYVDGHHEQGDLSWPIYKYLLFLTFFICNEHDAQTLIPTVKGMVVAEWLEKHFPDLVEARFTAHMEDSLDKIARGEQDKLSFLSDFYLGEPSKQQEGLLARVAHKLERQEIDHKESRTLEVPFLSDLGVLQLGRSGAFIERRSAMTPALGLLTQALELGSENGENDFSNLGGSGNGNSSRWKLPEAMQIDLREITREAVEFLISNEQSMQGAGLDNDTPSRYIL